MHFSYIKNIVILLMLILTFGFSAVDLECATKEQNTTITYPWRCPELPSVVGATNNFNAELVNVNVHTGEYECKYNYAGKGRATSCRHISIGYLSELNDKLNIVSQDLDLFQTVDFKNIYPLGLTLPTGLQPLDVDVPPDLSDRVDDLTVIVNDAITELKDRNDSASVYATSTFFSNALYYSIMSNTQRLSYNHLVRPYVTSTPIAGVDADKEKTFSRFVLGMVTLDSDVVDGYDEFTGNVHIKNKWETKPKINISITSILDTLKSYYTGEEKKNNTEILDFRLNPTGWINIFQKKIWGFYYNLQRRLDIGYEILSTQLLFLMMVFFAMTTAARGGARYITNREQGMSSGEVKINESSIMKTLGILATIFVFFISVPTQINPSINNNIATQSSEVQFEMRTNQSLGKSIIRYAMEQGTYFGTMMADLGTDAFLEYIIKKQGLYRAHYETETYKETLSKMVYYYPSLQLSNECAKQQIAPVNKLLSGGRSIWSEKNPDYNVSNSPYADFLRYNWITRINPEVCIKATKDVYKTIENVADNTYSLLDRLDNANILRAKTTRNIVENHIELQEEIGWMNIVAVPYTYFLMKYQELFFETTLAFDDIEKNTRSYIDNLGLRDGNDVLDENKWYRNRDITKGKLQTAQKIAEEESKMTRFAFYNFLPMFTQIKNEISQRLQSLYSDILRLRRTDSKGNINTSYTDNMEAYKSLLKSMMNNANNTFKGPMTQKEVLDKISTIDQDPIILHTTIQFVSYTVAMATWKIGFIIVFLSAIAMMIGFKIVLYVIDVLIHFFIAPFIVLWAFTSGEGGTHKIKNYLRDTLIYMMYPSMIVIGVFIFIFAYELFHNIYGFIVNILLEGQLNVISNAVVGAGKSIDTPDMSYLTIYSLRDMTEIFIDLLSVYVAFVVIYKFPETVLKLLGINDSGAAMISQNAEKLSGKGGGSVNPLSR